MAKDVTKVATLSVELATYSSIFNAVGLALIGEFHSDTFYHVHATKGGALFGTPQYGATVKDAVNSLVGSLGLKPTSNQPYFP